MGANPAANSPTFQRNSKPYTKYACIFFIHGMCTAPGKLVTKKRALKLPSSCAIEFIFNSKTVQLEMIYKTTSCHDFNHTVFKVLKGRPKILMLRAREVKRSRDGPNDDFVRGGSLILMMMSMPRSVRRARGERLLRLLKASARCKPGRVSSGHLCPSAPKGEHFNEYLLFLCISLHFFSDYEVDTSKNAL